MITRLVCVARVLVVISLVFGVDVLAQTINTHGDFGKACLLRDNLNQASCSGTGTTAVRRRQDPSFDNVSRRADEFTPTPSTCTCTIPFFNIWSACTLFEIRSNTLPLLKDLTTQCQNAGVSFRNSSQLEPEFFRNAKLPQWSKVDVQGDQVFDAFGIVRAALPWNALQITAPIASAVSVACILGLLYFIKFFPRQKRYSQTPYNHSYWRSSTGSTEKEKRSTVFERIQNGMNALRPERVKSEEPKADWEIDSIDREAQLGGAGTNRLSVSSTRSTTTQATTNLSWGPLPATSSRLDQAPAPPPTFTNPFQLRPSTPQHHNPTPNSQHQPLVDEDDNDDDDHESGYHDPFSQPPLTSKWSESGHMTPPLGKSGSSNVHSKWTPPGAKTSWKGLKGFPFSSPFKRKPVRVQAVQPKAGFRLDDYDRNTESMLSRVVSKNSGGRSEGDEDSVVGGNSGSVVMDQAFDYNEDFSGPSHSAQGSGGGAGDDDERATLISGAERRKNHVFLISKPGREDFSVSGMTMSEPESGTNLSSTMSIGVVSPTASTISSFRAPAADVIWRNTENTKVHMAAIPPPPSRPPPISPPKPLESLRGKYPLANLLEEPGLPSIRERSGSESAASSTRWEPIAIDQSSGPPASPNLLLPPLKLVYEAERYPSVDSLHSSASGSGNPRRAYGSASSTCSSSSGTKPPRPLPQPQQHYKVHSLPSITPPAAPTPTAVPYFHQQLSPPPHATVMVPHRRAISEDDVTASFYQQSTAESSYGGNLNLGATRTPSNSSSVGTTPSGTSQAHSRTGSLEPANRRSNPQNLFPPSVRAAGYSGGVGMVSAVKRQ